MRFARSGSLGHYGFQSNETTISLRNDESRQARIWLFDKRRNLRINPLSASGHLRVTYWILKVSRENENERDVVSSFQISMKSRRYNVSYPWPFSSILHDLGQQQRNIVVSMEVEAFPTSSNTLCLKLERLFNDLHQAYSPLKAFQVNNNALQSRISSIKAKHLETPSAENLLPFIRIQLSFLSLIKSNRSQYTSNIRIILAESRSFASSSFQLFITPTYVHIRLHVQWMQVRLRRLVTYFI